MNVVFSPRIYPWVFVLPVDYKTVLTVSIQDVDFKKSTTVVGLVRLNLL